MVKYGWFDPNYRKVRDKKDDFIRTIFLVDVTTSTY